MPVTRSKNKNPDDPKLPQKLIVRKKGKLRRGKRNSKKGNEGRRKERKRGDEKSIVHRRTPLHLGKRKSKKGL